MANLRWSFLFFLDGREKNQHLDFTFRPTNNDFVLRNTVTTMLIYLQCIHSLKVFLKWLSLCSCVPCDLFIKLLRGGFKVLIGDQSKAILTLMDLVEVDH